VYVYLKEIHTHKANCKAKIMIALTQFSKSHITQIQLLIEQVASWSFSTNQWQSFEWTK